MNAKHTQGRDRAVASMTRAFKRLNGDRRRVKRWLNAAWALHHAARRADERKVDGTKFDKPTRISHRVVKEACALTQRAAIAKATGSAP